MRWFFEGMNLENSRNTGLEFCYYSAGKSGSACETDGVSSCGKFCTDGQESLEIGEIFHYEDAAVCAALVCRDVFFSAADAGAIYADDGNIFIEE